MTNLQTFPSDIIFNHLFFYLDDRALCLLSRTCKQFFFLCNQDAIWKGKLENFFPDVFEKLSKVVVASWKNAYFGMCVYKTQVYLPGVPFSPGARSVIKYVWVHRKEPISKTLHIALAEYVQTLHIRVEDFTIDSSFVVEKK